MCSDNGVDWMKILGLECLVCGSQQHIDIRYLFNGETYQLEYHCESHTGGCNFYRLLPMHFHPQVGDL